MHSLRPVVCPPACFERQPHAQSPSDVACPLPEGFDGDEGRGFPARHVNEAAPMVLRALPPSFTIPIACFSTYSSMSFGAPCTVSPPPSDIKIPKLLPHYRVALYRRPRPSQRRRHLRRKERRFDTFLHLVLDPLLSIVMKPFLPFGIEVSQVVLRREAQWRASGLLTGAEYPVVESLTRRTAYGFGLQPLPFLQGRGNKGKHSLRQTQTVVQ